MSNKSGDTLSMVALCFTIIVSLAFLFEQVAAYGH